ncbi:acyl-protein synthetase [Actinoplanes sp. NPDC049548]|uniref:LuxE/PaaK family acyltransferase n=1 Tax=Actinoplanes sp. NPDC049548 TaxID=3155152 RepID=UPI003435408E
MSLDELFERPQYSLEQSCKERLLVTELRRLTEHHRRGCAAYARILATLPPTGGEGLAGVPYLPVSLFKSHRLVSIPDAEVFKVMTSSGTTGQAVSSVVVDRATAERQSRALTTIMATVLGPRRLPMIIIDAPNVVRDRRRFNARAAGVLGMASLGRRHFYALDDDMQLDRDGLRDFLRRHDGEPLLIFGFTYMVWRYLLQRLDVGEADLSGATLIHSGGWKALQDQAVDNGTFKRVLGEVTGLRRVHNFYGMVEQVGSVFLEGPDGFLHPPNFADVIIRDPATWQEAPDGTVGVIEVLSALPLSYPGHALLTEDLGVVHGVGDPAQGWGGRRLEVVGRVPRAELRGCSDVHARVAEAVPAA